MTGLDMFMGTSVIDRIFSCWELFVMGAMFGAGFWAAHRRFA